VNPDNRSMATARIAKRIVTATSFLSTSD